MQQNKLEVAQGKKIMGLPQEKLLTSLEILKTLRSKGRNVFRSNEIGRVHRERLLNNGFLKEIMKGWFLSTHPEEREGESTSWYANFWEFLSYYCQERFGKEWHLSPEQSLLIYAENRVIPQQVIIYSPKGANNQLSLLFNTSLYDFKQTSTFSLRDIHDQNGLHVYKLV